MGIHGIYKEIGPGRRIALSKLALEKFEETDRPFRIAIDVSIWLFQIQASKGGTNPALRTFYYRLLRLISLSIHPVFVFDGPNKPPFKRNKRTGANVASIPEFLAKQLLKQFGFPIHLAPGEAEAECALLQREGIVDAVLSEDVDTLMFGSGLTIRNWSPEQKSGKTPTHVNVYDAVETKNGPAGLDREGMILIALMSGGDYVPEGIPGCGPKTACEAARAGFGKDLCKIAKNDARAFQDWRERLQHELNTNKSKLFTRKRPSLKIPEDFPRRDILGYYTHPAISSDAGLKKLKDSIKWDQDLDFPGLRDFARDAFDWVKLEGAKHFVRSLAPSLLVRHLRTRGEHTERFPTDDIKAIEEDEALLVKGIHGKRQHPITDSTTELRVSFIPIHLVKIDLTIEEPDDDLDATGQWSEAPEVDIDDEAPLEIDDEERPKPRGPTKFDPHKPARVWVLETYVKVGVPLKVQDWEAGQQKPQKVARTASKNDANKAVPKNRGTRAAKMSGTASQATIERFTKVTKPGTKFSRALAKAQNEPSSLSTPVSPSKEAVVNLLSSPLRPSQKVLPPPREKSLSPLQEDVPFSLTKRKRGPIQRAQTLPSNLAASSRRPNTPPLDIIETLDLVDSPALPSPFQLPTKKPKTHITKSTTITRAAESPRKTKQSTLDSWQRMGVVGHEKPFTSKRAQPIAARPFEISEEGIDTLDLTLSSPRARPPPPKPFSLPKPPPPTNPRRTIEDIFAPRPPLASISSNASQTSSTTSSSTTRPTNHTSNPNPELTSTTGRKPPRRTSPRLARKTKSPSPEIESLDLTALPPPQPVPPSTVTTAPPTAPTTNPFNPSLPPSSPPPAPVSTPLPPRRSPRLTKSPSPPATRNAQAKKKRAVVLRKSLAGAWRFEDVSGSSSPIQENDATDKKDTWGSRNGACAGAKKGVSREGSRRKWRESEIEVLDLS